MKRRVFCEVLQGSNWTVCGLCCIGAIAQHAIAPICIREPLITIIVIAITIIIIIIITIIVITAISWKQFDLLQTWLHSSASALCVSLGFVGFKANRAHRNTDTNTLLNGQFA